MKIHRFIDNFDLSKKELEIQGEIAHQIIKVLKLEMGEQIELGDGKGVYAIAEIVEIKNKNVMVTLLRQGYEGQDSTKKVNLFCAVLKRQNFELVVQKATECGISKIVPILSARTIKTGLNLERLKKIAKEASEQSGRAIVPEITEVKPLYDYLGLINKNDINILFDSSGELLFKMPCININKNLSYKMPCEDDGPNTRNFSAEKYPCILEDKFLCNIFIGPEGGWSKEEIEKAKSLNFKIASLGKLTLRAETAAIVASYLISNN